MSDDVQRVEVAEVGQWHAWLLEHHGSVPAVWVVTWKKRRGPQVPYDALVEEALCFGWVDTKGMRVDDDRTALLLTPRRAGSGWSRPNKQRVATLVATGRMQPAGQAVVDRAVADGSWTRLDDVENLVEPDDLRRALDAVPEARLSWDGFPRSAKRAVLAWLVDARRAPTRERRIAETVSEAAQGRRAHQ